MAGSTLNRRYRLIEELGSGAMATVWRAYDRRLKCEVALKILDRVPLGNSVLVERFYREARTSAKLEHPNIVRVLNYGATRAGTPFLVMELLDGRTIQSLLADGPLPVDQAVSITAQVCAGLAAAHEAGVVHRDIKPANMMLTTDGTAKILDFGIAHLHGALLSLTQSGMQLGTSVYMAPEQTSGEPVDARADLYALGCVLYEMLTGSPPFVGENPTRVSFQHRYEKPEPPSKRREEVSRRLERLVLSLLAKDPADRPQTAQEARDQLLQLAEAGPSSDPDPGRMIRQLKEWFG